MTFEELVEYVSNHSEVEGNKAIRSYAKKNNLSVSYVDQGVFIRLSFGR